MKTRTAALTFNAANLNSISIADIDAAAGDLTTTVNVADGALSVGSVMAGLQVSGEGTNMLVLTGTLGEINDALEGLSYVPTSPCQRPAHNIPHDQRQWQHQRKPARQSGRRDQSTAGASMVTGSELAVSSRTLAWLRAEYPRLPVSRLPSQEKNWTTNGWSRP